MQTEAKPDEKPYLFRQFKTYSVEEIIAAGGTTAFGRLSHYDPAKLLELKGESLTEDEYRQALALLTK